MPFFLFIVGVAIALALKKIPKINDAIKKICLRTLKLLFWGVLLQEIAAAFIDMHGFMSDYWFENRQESILRVNIASAIYRWILPCARGQMIFPMELTLNKSDGLASSRE